MFFEQNFKSWNISSGNVRPSITDCRKSARVKTRCLHKADNSSVQLNVNSSNFHLSSFLPESNTSAIKLQMFHIFISTEDGFTLILVEQRQSCGEEPKVSEVHPARLPSVQLRNLLKAPQSSHAVKVLTAAPFFQSLKNSREEPKDFYNTLHTQGRKKDPNKKKKSS